MECLLSWIAPRICLLCGDPLARSQGIPLCQDCALKIEVLKGPRCSICGRSLFSESGTCYECRDLSSPLLLVHPLFAYRGEAAELLRLYKARGRVSLAPFWADLLTPSLERRHDWAIVPVPPRQEKMRKGIPDQVEAIAAILERRGFQVSRILERLSSDQQKKLDKEARKSNAEKSYALSPKATRPLPRRALLLDDVVTTGATLRSCARALREGGCEEVEALALAYD